VVSDDLPKENPWQEDRLGYKPFCERLSKAILALQVPNGYVIGLHGEWGSGKSTALNFVAAFLRKHNQECADEKSKLILVDFRPWIVSGHQDLIAAFFKVMAETLGPRPNWLSRQWKRALHGMRVGGDSLIDAVATVAVTVDPSGGVASKAVSTVAKKTLGGMVDNFLADPSLQAAHKRLQKELRKSGQRFLVTIDDLDRLQEDEIRSIMQMVKTVGQLPNVIYLLAYDRKIVWASLDGHTKKSRPRFAEKIVQQELELPRPSRDALLSMLDREIDFLTGVVSDSLRWHQIVHHGVRRWIRHPRDLLRLANAVKFSWPALNGEIDPADLLAMEGLRLFDVDAFNWIRWNREFLFSDGPFMMASDETVAVEARRLKDNLAEEARAQTLSLLAVLFPRSIKAFEGEKAMSEETPASTASRRGIGCAPGYDAYFGMHPSSDAIPKTVIDNIVGDLGDEAALRKLILPYFEKHDRRGQPLIANLLEELRYRFKAPVRPHPTQEFLDVLFEFGDRVLSINWKDEAFTLTPRSQLSFLIADILQEWGERDAGSHLVASFKKSNSASFCANVFVDRARELGKFPEESKGRPTVSEEDFKTLGAELLAKIERSAADETLENAPYYFDIVRAWSYLGKPAEAKAWLSNGVTKSEKFLVKVGKGLVSYTLGEHERTYSLRSRPEDFYDIKVIRGAVRRFEDSIELTQDERNMLAAIGKGIDWIVDADAKALDARAGEG